MAMRSLNLDQLRAFVEVVERGSFTAAAKELNLTQPAVTHQVQELERRFNVARREWVEIECIGDRYLDGVVRHDRLPRADTCFGAAGQRDLASELEGITETAHRVDQLWIRRVVFHLLA